MTLAAGFVNPNMTDFASALYEGRRITKGKRKLMRAREATKVLRGKDLRTHDIPSSVIGRRRAYRLRGLC